MLCGPMLHEELLGREREDINKLPISIYCSVVSCSLNARRKIVVKSNLKKILKATFDSILTKKELV